VIDVDLYMYLVCSPGAGRLRDNVSASGSQVLHRCMRAVLMRARIGAKPPGSGSGLP
jgi:hypothetical protein